MHMLNVLSFACQHQCLANNIGLLIAQCTERLLSVHKFHRSKLFSSILAAICPRWGQIHIWAHCEQTSLWGFDDRPAADRCYHPGVPVATYLWVWTRREDTDFLPRYQGQELCHRVLQHSHTRPNQVFSLQHAILLVLLFLLLHGTSVLHLVTFLPALVHLSSTPLHWV